MSNPNEYYVAVGKLYTYRNVNGYNTTSKEFNIVKVYGYTLDGLYKAMAQYEVNYQKHIDARTDQAEFNGVKCIMWDDVYKTDSSIPNLTEVRKQVSSTSEWGGYRETRVKLKELNKDLATLRDLVGKYPEYAQQFLES